MQNGPFLRLHKEKSINFLARAWESDFYGNRENHALYKAWFYDVVDNHSHDAVKPIGVMSDDLPNLLSEGLFIMNELRNETIQGPQALFEYFSRQADKLDVLIVIRNQPDLIQSYYIQGYRRFEQKLFTDFLAQHMKSDWKGEGKIFNFHDVASAYSAVFGKDNIHIILFEDFVRRKELFSNQLAKALGIDPAVIKRLVGEDHLNKTPKEPGILVVRRHYAKTLRGQAIRTLEKFAPRLADSLRIRVPVATEAERNAIVESFRVSNLRLADEFSLDKQAMREYGYF